MERETVLSAEQRYPDLFALIDATIDCFSDVIDTGELPIAETQLQFVRACCVMRTYNILKSIRQLLATDHWENAAILMRSLFELDLNVEELERDPTTAEQQAERFIRFETLQRYLRYRSEDDYEVKTNRKSNLDPRLAAIEKDLPTFFGEWATRRNDGTIKWKSSWCGKNVKQLCEAKGSSIRMGQYEIIYAFGSNMAHSSPLSVLSTFKQNDAVDWMAFAEANDQSERRAALMVASLSLTFACEVVAATHFLDGAFDPLKLLRVSRQIYALYGVTPPPLRPEVQAALQYTEDDKP